MLEEGSFSTTLEGGHNCFCYVYGGRGKIGDKGDAEPQTAYIVAAAEGRQGLSIEAGADGLKCLVISGEPLNEPVVQHGPFVMTTEEEIHQAFYDYRTGNFARDSFTTLTE